MKIYFTNFKEAERVDSQRLIVISKNIPDWFKSKHIQVKNKLDGSDQLRFKLINFDWVKIKKFLKDGDMFVGEDAHIRYFKKLFNDNINFKLIPYPEPEYKLTEQYDYNERSTWESDKLYGLLGYKLKDEPLTPVYGLCGKPVPFVSARHDIIICRACQKKYKYWKGGTSVRTIAKYFKEIVTEDVYKILERKYLNVTG